MIRTRTLLVGLLACGCAVPVRTIDSRYDAGGPIVDAPSSDVSIDAMVAMPDGGCALSPPDPPRDWTPIDTGGPSGESLSACLARVGSMVDVRVPESQAYDLTTFGGGADTQPVACGGPDADGTWYYAANRQRFACGQRVRLVTPDRAACVIVEVADVGPNACVEEAGGEPIWDVSPLAADALFGVSSVGYSEHRAVLGAPVGNENPLGPCASAEEDLRGFIGGACARDADCTYAGGRCLTDGFPRGHCTLDCTSTSCPDRTGSFAYTGCAPIGGEALCAARCDYTLFATGCREGYGCETVPHPTNPSAAPRRVCLPLACE